VSGWHYRKEGHEAERRDAVLFRGEMSGTGAHISHVGGDAVDDELNGGKHQSIGEKSQKR